MEWVIGRKRSDPAAAHQAPETGTIENSMQHVRVVASRLLNGQIVAAATGDCVHTRP